jgi:hypothetical protein
VELLDSGAGEEQPRDLAHLRLLEDARFVQRRAQVVELVGVGLLAEHRRSVVGRERRDDRVRVVGEVEHEGVVLGRVSAIEARERLHRLDARERLVDVHRVQQRLVVAGLELVRADEQPVGVLADLLLDPARGKPLSDASLTRLPRKSCSPLKATIASIGLLRSRRQARIAWKYSSARWIEPVTTIARAAPSTLRLASTWSLK